MHGNRKKIEYKINENGCHICTSHKATRCRYPKIWFEGKQIAVSRYIYIQNFGEIPQGFVVRHKCDNPLCINPEHLEIGTHEENMYDMVSRGRSLKGEKHNRAKLTESQVKDIRKSSFGCDRLSRLYKVDRSTIKSIRRGETWKHVS